MSSIPSMLRQQESLMPSPSSRGFVKIAFEFYDNPKISRIGLAEQAIYLHMIVYCGRNMTDGFVPSNVAKRFAQQAEESNVLANASANTVIDTLIENGLLEPTASGYQVHDYLDYQESKEDIENKRKSNAKRQRDFQESRRRNNTLVTPLLTTQEKEKEKEKERSDKSLRLSAEQDAPKPPRMTSSQMSSPCDFEIGLTDETILYHTKKVAKNDPEIDEQWVRTRLREAFFYDPSLDAEEVMKRFRKAIESVNVTYVSVKNGKKLQTTPVRYAAKAFFYSMIGYEPPT